MISFKCPACSARLSVKDQFAGRRAKCPNCRNPVAVPTIEEIPTVVPAVEEIPWVVPVELPPRNFIYRSPAELFADMPVDAYPRGGKDGIIERRAATEWMKKYRVGHQHQLEWTGTIKEVVISEQYDHADRFVVFLKEEGDIETDCCCVHVVWPEPFLFDGTKCGTAIAYGGPPSFQGEVGLVSSSTAKKIREWKGKTITHRAPILRAEFLERPSWGTNDNFGFPVWCVLGLSGAPIDGWDPPLLEQ